MQCVRQINNHQASSTLCTLTPADCAVGLLCATRVPYLRVRLDLRLLLLLVLKSLAGLYMFLHLDDINKIEDVHVADDADVVLEQGESGEQRRCADKYFWREK